MHYFTISRSTIQTSSTFSMLYNRHNYQDLSPQRKRHPHSPPQKTPRPPSGHTPRRCHTHQEATPTDATPVKRPLPQKMPRPSRNHAHRRRHVVKRPLTTLPSEDATPTNRPLPQKTPRLSSGHSPLPFQKTPRPSRGRSPMKSSLPSRGHAPLPLPQLLATTHLLSVYVFAYSGHFL